MNDGTDNQPSLMSDEELLAAIAEERPGAFDAFVERYGRRLLAFGLRMCRHQEDAEDVFQETLFKAYQSLSRLEDPRALGTWLFRIVSRQCLMKRRKEVPGREISIDETPAPGSERDLPPFEIPDAAHLPDDDTLQAELHEALQEAIDRLPSDHRIVVLLRDVEGFSTRETAEILEVGLSAVKMRLHRAHQALREELASYQELLA